MPIPEVKRVNVCFPKNDHKVLDLIDQTRGKQSRSQAIQRILAYVCAYPENLKGIIEYDFRNNQG